MQALFSSRCIPDTSLRGSRSVPLSEIAFRTLLIMLIEISQLPTPIIDQKSVNWTDDVQETHRVQCSPVLSETITIGQ